MKNDRKYEAIDKSVTNSIMTELKGKTIDTRCSDCDGRGWFLGLPKSKSNTEHMGTLSTVVKCDNCNGKGHYEIQY